MHPDDRTRLEAFLASPSVAPLAMDLHGVQGLACALVLGPRVVSPAIWMGWVWDREQGWRAPEFADLEHANAVMASLMTLYNEISRALGPAAEEGAGFDPGFRSAGLVAVASFCAGLRRGMAFEPDDWAPLAAEHPEWLELLHRPDPPAAEVEALLPALRRYWRGRSDRLEPLRAGEVWDRLHDAFEFVEKPFPREAVALAHRHRETVAPRLLQVLDEVLRDPEPARDGAYALHHYAMVLLACWRDTRAYRPLLAFARLPSATLDDLLGDTLTETFGRVLASVCDGDMAPLAEIVGDEGVSIWARMALLDAWKVRVMEGDAPASPLEDLLLELGGRDAERLRRDGRDLHEVELIDDVASLACDLGSTRIAERVREWFDARLIDEKTIDRPWFEKEFARSADERLATLRERKRSYITDVEAEIGWWASYHGDDDADDGDADDPRRSPGPQRDHPAPTTIVRDTPKIGRNDPCPCGSGRKYKKCHGAN